VFVLLSLAVVGLSANSVLAQSKAADGFEALTSLVGEWQGKGPDGRPLAVSYEILSGGSALMETRTPTKEPSMVTVFHLDGDQLMMTHYCSIGNQPRMRADAATAELKTLNFTFVDVTNMAHPSDGHMRGLTFTFEDDDHITQVWTWRQEGNDTPATFHLERQK
jgi:hypothetical protein